LIEPLLIFVKLKESLLSAKEGSGMVISLSFDDGLNKADPWSEPENADLILHCIVSAGALPPLGSTLNRTETRHELDKLKLFWHSIVAVVLVLVVITPVPAPQVQPVSTQFVLVSGSSCMRMLSAPKTPY
jgi:hypothetical protein